MNTGLAQLQKTIGRPLPLAYGAAIIEAEHVHEVIRREGQGGYCKTGFLITFTREGEDEPTTWESAERSPAEPAHEGGPHPMGAALLHARGRSNPCRTVT